jgi:hypothetical protein
LYARERGGREKEREREKGEVIRVNEKNIM